MNDATGTVPTASAHAFAPQASHQRVGLRRRLGVVPELGGTEHPALVVEHDHAVLLAGHRDGGDVVTVLVEQRRQGRPPLARILLAAGRDSGGVRALPGSHELAGVGVAHLDLARLGGGVDAGDERHASTSARRHPGFEREQHRARDPGIAVDPAGDDRYLLGLQCVLRERAAQRIEQELECVGGFTAHDHELGVEDADEVRGAEPQHVAGVVEHTTCAVVSVARGAHHVVEARRAPP